MKNTKQIIVLASIAAVLMLGLFIGSTYFVVNRLNNGALVPASPAPELAAQKQQSSPTPAASDSIFPFPGMTTGTTDAKADSNEDVGVSGIILRLLLAVLLSAILAFRPRKNIPLFRRNLSVAQTQILLAVVAAALMMIVGDNAARAFAIFAAVSLVRFRTNIRDPKEVTVLLISLSLGLAAGVGRWELGIALCLFALVLLWFLEFKEPEQVFRSMELTVKTSNTDSTQDLLKKVFDRYKLEAEVRQFDPPDEKTPIGSIVYYLNLPLNLSTDYLSDVILNSDGDYIEGIQWQQKKGSSYIYQ